MLQNAEKYGVSLNTILITNYELRFVIIINPAFVHKFKAVIVYDLKFVYDIISLK